MLNELPGWMLALTAVLKSGLGAWLLRATMAAVFLYSAQDKLRHRVAAVSEVRAGGLPLPAVMLGMTITVQAAGGLALITPWPAVIAAGGLLLAGFTFLATLLFHSFWLTRGEIRQHQLTGFLEHLVMVGGLLVLVSQQSGSV